MHRYQRTLTIVVCLMLHTAVPTYAQPQYTLTDLGAFVPTAIAGPWVFGYEPTAPHYTPIRLNMETGERLLLSHFGRGGIPNTAHPSSGAAIGTAKITVQGAPNGELDVATFWASDGSAWQMPGPIPSYGLGINEEYVMVGFSTSCPDGHRALRWWPDTPEPECLQANGTGTIFALGAAVDAQNRVWGQHSDTVAMWNEDGEETLLPAHGAVWGGNHTFAVGEADNTGAHFVAPATVTKLPKPAIQGIGRCLATGVNGHGQAVGWCSAGVRPTVPFPRAVYWPNATTVIDLESVTTPGVRLQRAVGINDDGEIIVLAGDNRSVLLTPVGPQAAQCGGPDPCRCGDTVVRDYTFPGPLGPCAQGLRIASGVQVHGNGQVLSGSGGGVGVLFDGAQGADVGSLHVTGFEVGVKFQGGARGNRYHDSWVWGHTQNGLWFEAGVQENVVVGVNALLNGEYGVVLTLAERNTVAYVTAWSNGTSLALHATDRNTFWTNTWYGDRGDAALVTDSHGNVFYFDTFACAPGYAIVLRDSEDTDVHQVRIGCPVRREPAVASQEELRHGAD